MQATCPNASSTCCCCFTYVGLEAMLLICNSTWRGPAGGTDYSVCCQVLSPRSFCVSLLFASYSMYLPGICLAIFFFNMIQPWHIHKFRQAQVNAQIKKMKSDLMSPQKPILTQTRSHSKRWQHYCRETSLWTHFSSCSAGKRLSLNPSVTSLINCGGKQKGCWVWGDSKRKGKKKVMFQCLAFMWWPHLVKPQGWNVLMNNCVQSYIGLHTVASRGWEYSTSSSAIDTPHTVCATKSQKARGLSSSMLQIFLFATAFY